MRKIPGVNTHIFKQPNIPWKDDYPYKLSPLLWLDSTDLDYITLDGTDVNALLDKSNTSADFVLGTAPTIDNTTNPTKVTFTASNSEYLENTLDIASFSGLSTCSFIYVNDNNLVQFSISDSTQGSSFLWVGAESTGEALLRVRNTSSTVNNRLNSTNTISIGDVVEWRINDSSYQCFINGIEDVVVVAVGLNNGSGLDTIPDLDNISIGRIGDSSPIYYDNVFKELIITSTPLTDAQSLNLANYLISKHDL
jgi:hypothetical protein